MLHSFYLERAIFYMGGARDLSDAVVLRGRLARRIREEAGKLGVSVEEYVVELLSQDLDPRDRALEYIETAKYLLEEARRELGKGNVRQAAEKLWGASGLIVKAYAYWREGKRLASHGELWSYMRLMAGEMGSWVRGAWMYANGMHTCFYEGWCAREDVEDALKAIERLLGETASKIKRDQGSEV